MTTETRTLTQRLKDDNWDLHQIAEHAADGPSRLVQGTMPLDEYKAMLAQDYLWHAALDEALRSAVESEPRLGSLIEENQYRAANIADDLAYFGVDAASIDPSPGTTRFVEHVARVKHDPMAVLGLHYVRTGATNGNRFVAKKVRKTFELPESGEGTKHLDPWGEQQRATWMAFKGKLDEIGFDENEQDRVFGSVREMYVYAINANRERHMPASELLEAHGDKLDKGKFDRDHAVPASN